MLVQLQSWSKCTRPFVSVGLVRVVEKMPGWSRNRNNSNELGTKRLRESKHRKIPHFIACSFHRWLIVTGFESERAEFFLIKGLVPRKAAK